MPKMSLASIVSKQCGNACMCDCAVFLLIVVGTREARCWNLRSRESQHPVMLVKKSKCVDCSAAPMSAK